MYVPLDTSREKRGVLSRTLLRAVKGLPEDLARVVRHQRDDVAVEARRDVLRKVLRARADPFEFWRRAMRVRPNAVRLSVGQLITSSKQIVDMPPLGASLPHIYCLTRLTRLSTFCSGSSSCCARASCLKPCLCSCINHVCARGMPWLGVYHGNAGTEAVEQKVTRLGSRRQVSQMYQMASVTGNPPSFVLL